MQNRQLSKRDVMIMVGKTEVAVLTERVNEMRTLQDTAHGKIDAQLTNIFTRLGQIETKQAVQDARIALIVAIAVFLTEFVSRVILKI